MNRLQRLARRLRIMRASWRRWNRLLFPSPAEVRFVEIMGGRHIQLKRIKHLKTKHPLTFILHLGPAMGEQRFGREVRMGRYFVDFGNDLLWAIEVDGRQWHMDVVKEQKRDEYLLGLGCRVKHIDARRLWVEPANVQIEMLKFLSV